MRRTVLVQLSAAAALLLASGALAASNVGYRDFSFAASGLGGAATPMMAQSKLWFNDDLWWGVLFDRSSEEYHIYRQEWASHSWNDTGTLVDERNFSKADALWDGNHLYAVSAGPNSTNSAHSARVSRYSYNAATRSYALDPRFRVTVTNSGMKTIVLDKDTTGKLWVTYTKNNHVYVNRSLSDQQTWGTPFVLPVTDSAVSSDDISAVVAFGSQIGVMWSNQLDDAMYFATHTDGKDDEVWQESRTAMATNASTGEGSDTFLGVENLLGSSKADTLTRSATNNKLTGGGGPDTEQGGSGNDTLLGSGGDDEINSKDGVNGNDSLDGRAGTDTKVTDTTEKSIVNFPQEEGVPTEVSPDPLGTARTPLLLPAAPRKHAFGLPRREATGVLYLAVGVDLVQPRVVVTTRVNPGLEVGERQCAWPTIGMLSTV